MYFEVSAATRKGLDRLIRHLFEAIPPAETARAAS
jgi:hypothetical protein